MRRAALLLLCGSAVAAPRAATPRDPITAPDPVAAARALLPGRRLALVAYRQSLTGEHVHFRPLAPDGTPVAGAHVSVHLAGAAPRYRPLLVWDDDEASGAMVGARGPAADAARAAASVAGGAPGEPEAVAVPRGGRLRPGWRVLVRAPGRVVEVWVDAGGARVVGDLVQRAMVYRPNPVVTTGDTGLVDDDNADSAALTAARESVTLPFLDGSGMLRGPFADVSNPSSRVSDGNFDHTRSQPGFEEVNAYFHLTRVQSALQALGYTGPKAILDRQQRVLVNAFPDDQSNFNPTDKIIRFGAGGVDDAEDGDVVAHEYGHALQDFLVSGYRGADDGDSGALAEGFCDTQALVLPTGAAVAYDRHCFAAWDARGLGRDCLRRTDTAKHNPEARTGNRYPDSEIWSGALADVLAAAGLTPEMGYQLVVESTFFYNPFETFDHAAGALLQADEQLHGGAHADAIRRVLTWRGVISDIQAPVPAGATLRGVPVALQVGPLGGDVDQSMTFSQPGASALRVHFAQVDMDAGDGIYVYGADGNAYARIDGSDPDAPVVPGDTVTVRWVTTPTGTSAGFTVAWIDVLAAAVAPDAGPGESSDGCSVASGRGGLGWLLLVILGWRALRRGRRRPRW